MSAAILLGAALAGGAGAVVRVLVDLRVSQAIRHRFPLGTLVVNISGSLCLGIVVGLTGSVFTSDAVTVIGTGFVGGYTTFSTASVDGVTLLQRRRRSAAVTYIVITVVASVAAAATGLALGHAL